MVTQVALVILAIVVLVDILDQEYRDIAVQESLAIVAQEILDTAGTLEIVLLDTLDTLVIVPLDTLVTLDIVENLDTAATLVSRDTLELVRRCQDIQGIAGLADIQGLVYRVTVVIPVLLDIQGLVCLVTLVIVEQLELILHLATRDTLVTLGTLATQVLLGTLVYLDIADSQEGLDTLVIVAQVYPDILERDYQDTLGLADHLVHLQRLDIPGTQVPQVTLVPSLYGKVSGPQQLLM